MLIVQLVGGLGNQMLQYAMLRELQHLGKEAVLYRDYSDEYVKESKYNEIFDVFGIERKYISKQELMHYLGYDNFVKRQLYKHFGIRSKKHIVEEEHGKFDRSFLEYDDAYLDGYWQTDKYFSDVKKEIIKLYTPVLEPNDECARMAEQVKNDSASVAVHLRLGDYNSETNQRIYGNICTPEYYRAAFKYIKDKVQNPVFYVFSNDLDGAREFFDQENVVFVDCNEVSEAWADMHLMSLCRHNIIANSTFSWWGAYLNRNDGKIVVAPSKWKNTEEMPDICPEGWIRIKGN